MCTASFPQWNVQKMNGSCCSFYGFIYFSLSSGTFSANYKFCSLPSAFCVLHSHANTSHRLIALAMASATFTGHFVHALARQPRLLTRCMPPALAIKFFIFWPPSFPFCIMLACSANENKKYVWELLFKSTPKVAHLPGESVRASSSRTPSFISQVPKQFVRLSACAFLAT